MALRLPLQADPLAYDVKITLDNVRYELQLRWNWRAADWRISVREDTPSGEYVATYRRLSPGSMAARLPGGEIHVFGEDPYARKALGGSVYAVYYSDAEIDALKESAGTRDPAFTLV